jgi:hypothetical protein
VIDLVGFSIAAVLLVNATTGKPCSSQISPVLSYLDNRL